MNSPHRSSTPPAHAPRQRDPERTTRPARALRTPALRGGLFLGAFLALSAPAALLLPASLPGSEVDPGVILLPAAATAPAPASAEEGAPADAEAPHLRLERSTPAADSTVAASPPEIRLFFSEPPQMRGTSVRLTRGPEALVQTTDAAADGEDPKQVFIRPAEPLTPGAYTVHWRVIAQDGHTQRGTFEFRVATGGAAPR
jgi:methionine-rich copper-binding protein CopC